MAIWVIGTKGYDQTLKHVYRFQWQQNNDTILQHILKGAYHTFLKKIKKIKMEKTFIPQYFMPMSSHWTHSAIKITFRKPYKNIIKRGFLSRRRLLDRPK